LNEKLGERLQDAVYETLLLIEQVGLEAATESELSVLVRDAERLRATLTRICERPAEAHRARTAAP
jgi:hypothetical protein